MIPASGFALNEDRFLTQAFLRKWQTPQGLPQTTVLTLFQSKDLRIWIGTQSGLYRFDGLRFQTCRVTGGLSLENVWVQDLAETPDGAIWLATNGHGLVRYEREIAQEVSPEQGLSQKQLYQLLVDRSGDLWLGTDDGLYHFRDGHLSRISISSLPLTDIRALCETEEGRLCVGGEGNTLYVRHEDDFRPLVVQSLSPGVLVTSLAPTGDQTIAVGSTHGVVLLSPQGEVLLNRASGLADDVVECLEVTRQGRLWIGTRDGISRYRRGEVESFRTRDGLSQSTACSLLMDHEGSLWVGTKNGLNQFIDRRTIPLTVSEGLGTNDAGPLLQDEDGTIWIGTIGAGLGRLDGPRCVMEFGVEQGLPSNKLFALANGGKGRKWIGTDRGLCCLQNGQIVHLFTTSDGLPSNQIQALGRETSGRLWIGTDRGLVYWDESDSLKKLPDSVSGLEGVVLNITPRPDQGVYVATDQGVFEIQGEQVTPLLAQGKPIANVGSIALTDDGRLWLGTRDRGLMLVNPDGSSFLFSIRQGIYDDEIFGVVPDEAGRIWLACSRGIFFVDRKELLRCAAGEMLRVESRPFSPTESLRTVECQRGVQPAAVKMADERIWFSTNHGVLIMTPTNVQRNLGPPHVLIEEMQANGQIVDADALHSILARGRANVTFRYLATTYVVPQRVSFRYRLDGFDRDWIEAGHRREAFYTNLPPGHYRFRVAAMNQSGDWSEIDSPVDFRVVPYFYETWWFSAIIAGGLALAIWGAYRMRLMQIRGRLVAVMGERLRIARELHDTLIQGFSGVTMQMQALSNRLAPSEERETLKEVISDAGSCLKEARRTVAGLRSTPGNAGLATAIAHAAKQASDSNGIQVSLDLPPLNQVIPMEVEYHLLRIAQEAISNTIKHSGARHLDIQLQLRGRRIHLRVADDGRGFAPEALESQPPGHYGLIGIRERVLQIHGTLTLTSTPGQGTVVQVDVPIGSGILGSPQRLPALSDKDVILD